jgi:hypothetical protein
MFYSFITLQNYWVICSGLSKALCSIETLETDYPLTRGHIREEGTPQPTPSLASSYNLCANLRYDLKTWMSKCECYSFLWRNNPHRAQSASLLRCLDRTQTRALGRTLLNEWSVRRISRHLHNKQQTREKNIHALRGIRNRDHRNQAVLPYASRQLGSAVLLLLYCNYSLWESLENGYRFYRFTLHERKVEGIFEINSWKRAICFSNFNTIRSL